MTWGTLKAISPIQLSVFSPHVRPRLRVMSISGFPRKNIVSVYGLVTLFDHLINLFFKP